MACMSADRSNTALLAVVADLAQRFSAAVDWTNFERAETELKEVHAFMDSNEAEDQGIRLRLPGRV